MYVGPSGLLGSLTESVGSGCSCRSPTNISMSINNEEDFTEKLTWSKARIREKVLLCVCLCVCVSSVLHMAALAVRSDSGGAWSVPPEGPLAVSLSVFTSQGATVLSSWVKHHKSHQARIISAACLCLTCISARILSGPGCLVSARFWTARLRCPRSWRWSRPSKQHLLLEVTERATFVYSVCLRRSYILPPQVSLKRKGSAL